MTSEQTHVTSRSPARRRIAVAVLAFIVLTLVLFAVAAGIYAWRAFPVRDGQLNVSGLGAPVQVERDPADVTHIRAAFPRDAWFSLGYVHAQERGWQLEFNRRLMHGELSEVFGAATLDTDRLLRTLGIMQAAQRQWDGLPAEGREAMQAYSDGISAFYADPPQALSPEFHILGVKPGGGSGKPWSAIDCLGWSLMMALDLGGNWGTEFARLTAARTLDTRQLWQLFPPYPGEQPASAVDFARLYADLGIYRAPLSPSTKSSDAGVRDRVTLAAVDWAAGVGEVEGKGSNNWVVAGARSRSGKPLLANDPHLGLSAPAIWYVAHLQAPGARRADGTAEPALDAIGATLPGLPFVVLGRTPRVAWSFTNTNPDVQDLYLEQINPGNPDQYRIPGTGEAAAWANFNVRKEVIKVKGRPDVALTVRHTRHGPVLSDVQKSHADLLDLQRYVIALRFSALDADNQTVLAGLRANRAQSVAELISAFAPYHSPMQSVVAADVGGGMAFKAVGKAPLRRPDNDILGLAPSPGWDARYDWAGWLAYAQTPEMGTLDIEAKGWLATANQRITSPSSEVFMGQDWAVPYRHNRIEQLLGAVAKHDAASTAKIQGDLLSASTVKLLPYLNAALSPKPPAPPPIHPLSRHARQAMAGFEGAMRANTAAPLIFAAWADELTRGVIGARLGEDAFRTLYGKRNFRSAIESIMDTNDSAWCGPVGCAAQSAAALARALTRLEAAYGDDVTHWSWGRAHQALSAHKPFGNVSWLAPLFNVRVPSGGDAFTVNAGQYWSTGDSMPFANRQAASLRAIYDLAEPENSRFIFQTGQSGLVFSPRYRDMSAEWGAVAYRPLQMRPASLEHRLTLNP